MIATSTLQDTYNQGVIEATEKLSDCRPVDRVLFGLRAVLREAGRNYEIGDLWTRWNVEIGSLPNNCAVSDIALSLQEKAKRVIENYTAKIRENNRDHSYIVFHSWDIVKIWDFKRQVMQLIESDIKHHKPGLRKNNKEFKRLMQMVFCEAQIVILKKMSERLTEQIKTLSVHTQESAPGTLAKYAANERKCGEYLRSLAGDLQVLSPDLSSIEQSGSGQCRIARYETSHSFNRRRSNQAGKCGYAAAPLDAQTIAGRKIRNSRRKARV